jgi:transcriptional regulator with XRE-family HTH domain
LQKRPIPEVDMDTGARLREAREAKGLTVDALARITRVPSRLLAAIERNDLTAIPPRPYGRGFVRAYAGEVGLDPAETVREYFGRFEPAAPQPSAEAPRASAPLRFDDGEKRMSFGTPAVILLVLVGGLLAWGGWPYAPGSGERGAVGTSGNGHAAPAGAIGDAAPQPARATAPQSTHAAADGVSVVLDAHDAAWVAATADGKRAMYRTLQPGAHEILRATRELTIRVGDAGALTWAVGGREPVPMGARGAVRTVTVTPENASSIR